MKYRVVKTSRFRKDLKRMLKRGAEIAKLLTAIETISQGEPLPPSMRDHALTGDYSGFRECHITPDWLLIYALDNGALILTLTRTGSHSDLF